MPNQMMFLVVMILGVVTTLSSTSWLSAWFGLEVSTLAFIPILASQKNKMSNEAMLKYFLTQTLASTMILIPVLMNETTTQTWSELQNTMILLALTLKMGAAPLHFWMPQVMEGLSWKANIVLTTLQKIPPILMLTTIKPTLTFLISALSFVTGAFGGYNQTSLRKILAYSSIFHMGGMVLAMAASTQALSLYLMIYIITTLAIMTMMSTTNTNLTTQMYQLQPIPLTLLMMNLLSSGGLPPLLGFLPKWLLISQTIETAKPMLVIMIFSSMITLFFYIRVGYTAFLMSTTQDPSTQKFSLLGLITTSISVGALPLALATLS